jgi:hypothetical protein
MASIIAASLLAAQLASPIPAPDRVAHDWAAQAAAPDAKAIRQAVRAVLAEEDSEQSARRHEADTYRGDRYERFASDFAYARVPDCLRPEGLKHQSTYIFSGLLQVPFVLAAKLRGKCQ